jgi:hypothetical protein
VRRPVNSAPSNFQRISMMRRMLSRRLGIGRVAGRVCCDGTRARTNCLPRVSKPTRLEVPARGVATVILERNDATARRKKCPETARTLSRDSTIVGASKPPSQRCQSPT